MMQDPYIDNVVVSGTSITASWYRSASYYVVTFNGPITKSITTTETSCTADGLAPNSEYYVTLQLFPADPYLARPSAVRGYWNGSVMTGDAS